MLLLADGFDHYGDTATMLLGQCTSAGLALDTVNPRTGNYALRQDSNNFNYSRFLVGANITTIGVGIAIAVGNISIGAVFLSLVDDTNAPQLSFILQPSGSIQVRRGNAFGTIIAQTADGVISLAGGYQYLEFRCLINAAGSVEIRSNENTLLFAPVVNTKNTAYNGVASVVLGSDNSFGPPNPTVYYDDFIVWDTTTVYNNDFQGDVHCREAFVNADTAVTDWLASPAPPDFECINNVPPNIGQYVYSETVNDTSDYTITQTPDKAAAIRAVVMTALFNKNDVGAVSVKIGVNSNGVVSLSGDNVLAAARKYVNFVMPVNPDGGAGWNVKKVNLLRAEIKRTV